MKIIISPSKTKSRKQTINIKGTEPKFLAKADNIFNELSILSKDELKKKLKLSDKNIDEVYGYYHEKTSNTAINMYAGFVYKGLNLSEYTSSQIKYMNNTVIILSAMYGVLIPSDLVNLYRLDMNNKLENDLYKYWEEDINNYLEEELVINLASKEYSKLVKKEMINIYFMEQEGNDYRNYATYSKIARGVMLDYLIKNEIISIEDIKKFRESGYLFNEELSKENDLIFTRIKNK